VTECFIIEASCIVSHSAKINAAKHCNFFPPGVTQVGWTRARFRTTG